MNCPDCHHRLFCKRCGKRIFNHKIKKLCPNCDKTKPITEFYEYNTGGNTHTAWCADCIEWYIKNVSVGAN